MIQTTAGSVWTNRTVVNYRDLLVASPNATIQGHVAPNNSQFIGSPSISSNQQALCTLARHNNGAGSAYVQSSVATLQQIWEHNFLSGGYQDPTLPYTVVVVAGTGMGLTNTVTLANLNVTDPIAHDHLYFSFNTDWRGVIDNTSVLVFCKSAFIYGQIAPQDTTSFLFTDVIPPSVVDNAYAGWAVNPIVGGQFTPSVITTYSGTTKLFTVAPGGLDPSSSGQMAFISDPNATFEGVAEYWGLVSGTPVWSLLNGNYLSYAGVDNAYNGCTATVTSGTGTNLTNLITDYIQSTKTFSVNTPWQIDNTSAITIQNPNVYSFQGSVTSVLTNKTFTVAVGGFYNTQLYPIDGIYVGAVVYAESGAARGTANIITEYNPTTQIFTVQNSWTLDANSVISIFRPFMTATTPVSSTVGTSNSFVFTGTVTSMSGPVTLSANADNYNGYGLRVLSGKGAGLTNSVVGYSGSTGNPTYTFTTQNPWSVDTTSVIAVDSYSSFKDIALFGLPANHMILAVKIEILSSFTAGNYQGYPNSVYVFVTNSNNLLSPEAGDDKLLTDVRKTYGMANLTVPAGNGDAYEYGSFHWFTLSAPGTQTYTRRNNTGVAGTGNPTTGSLCLPQRLDAHDVIARFCILDYQDNSDLSDVSKGPEMETEWNFNSNVTTGSVEITVQYTSV